MARHRWARSSSRWSPNDIRVSVNRSSGSRFWLAELMACPARGGRSVGVEQDHPSNPGERAQAAPWDGIPILSGWAQRQDWNPIPRTGGSAPPVTAVRGGDRGRARVWVARRRRRFDEGG